MGLIGDLFSIPLRLANLPMKIVDEVVFDGDEMLSAPLDAINEGVKYVGDSVDRAIEKSFED